MHSANSPLEAGLLLRVRSWRDLIPWIALGDCLRPASSILSWALVAIALVATHFLRTFLPPTEEPASLFANAPLDLLKNISHEFLHGSIETVGGPWINFLEDLQTWKSVGANLAHQLLLAAIWVVPAGVLLRQSGLAMAGRLQLSTGEAIKFACRRSLAYLTVFLVPLLAIGGCRLYFWGASLAESIPGIGTELGGLLKLLGLPFALAVGVLGFGSILAIPLAWAAISNEREGNSFDGLSRGYEYVLRRPLQCVAYVTMAFVVAAILGLLAEGVALVAQQLVGVASGIAPPNQWFNQVIRHFPRVVVMTVGWSLVTWLYLLLRRSANNQEIEDVWESPRPRSEPLPTLDQSNAAE